MRAPDLRLIGADGPGGAAGPPGASRLAGVALASAVLLGALAATLLGADDSRRPIDARGVASEALQEALARGSDSREVHEALVELRRVVGRSPVDARTRVVYASLLLGVSRRVDDTTAAAFHAARAAELSPVRLSVVAPAASVLARSGDKQRALAVIRSIFGFEPDEAADLLSQIEPMLLGANVRDGLAERPEAWLAWSRRLQSTGRGEEGVELLADAYRRWPDDLELLGRVAAVAVRREDWDGLARLFAGDRVLPDETDAAPVLLYRSRHLARQGDPNAARLDVERALRIAGDDARMRVLAGETYEAVGDFERARLQWSRALFAAPAGAHALRSRALVLLARLEDREGRPADALRQWQALLDHEPGHAEAERRVIELSGASR